MTNKKKALVGLSIVLAVTVTIVAMRTTSDRGGRLFPGSPVLREISAPFQRGLTTVTDATRSFFGYFSDNRALRQQNENLTQTIAKLQENIQNLKEQETENSRLSAMLQYKQEKTDNYNLVFAKVIGRNPGNWNRTITIDKGGQAGIEPRMTVVNHDGLIGTVINVTDTTAEVLLILDSDAAVGARIFETRDTPGIVIGNDKEDMLQIVHLPHDVNIQEYQTIVTSGLGGLYPKGIRIGTVSKVSLESNGLMKTATIKPAVDFSRLEEVFVIQHVKNPEADVKADVVETGGQPAL